MTRRSNGETLEDTPPGLGRTVGPRWPRILMYHAIARAADDPNRICVSPRSFEVQMRYLKRRGLRGVSMRELLGAAGTDRANGLVGLTFDDAYENFLYAAVPIMEKYGFSATVFAVGGMLGEDNSWDEQPRMSLLGAEGLREVAERGMEVGSHGMSHIRLSGLPKPHLTEEIAESRRVLSDILDEEVTGFCYPYGSVDVAATRTARQAGYSYACACWMRVADNLYDLPRPPIWDMDGSFMLAAKLGLFPSYFDMTNLSVQNTLYTTGRLAHGGAKYVARVLNQR